MVAIDKKNLEEKKWKVVSSETILSNKWIKVKKEKCHLPNGTIIDDYYIFEKNDAAMVFAVTEHKKVLMVSLYKHGAQDHILELPSGILDDQESPEDAAKRELLEETGYSVNSVNKIGTMHFDPTGARGRCHLYFAQNAKKTSMQNLDKTEDITVIEMTPDELINNLRQNKIVGGLAVGGAFLGLEEWRRVEDEKGNN